MKITDQKMIIETLLSWGFKIGKKDQNLGLRFTYIQQ